MQVRKKLRSELKSRLLNKTKAEGRIDINPSHLDDPYPYLEISTPSDKGELISNSIRSTGQDLNLVIDIFDSTDDEHRGEFKISPFIPYA